MIRRTRVAAWLAVCVGFAAGIALGQFEPPPESKPVPPLTTEQPPKPPASAPSAESVLQDLMQQRGESAVTAPSRAAASRRADDADRDASGLLREGQKIQNVSGRLKRNSATGNTAVVFDQKQASYPPMIAVPSRRLMLMEDAAGLNAPGADAAGADMLFPINAEVTQYQGKNYLFLKRTAEPLPHATAPATAASKPATSEPTTAAAIVQPVAPGTPTTSIAEGQLVEGRVGRLVKDVQSGTAVIVFESDGKEMLDPPMGLIPCKYLAVMETVSDNGAKPIKFRVSGEITQYRGKNYLYLRSVTIIPDMGQGLSK